MESLETLEGEKMQQELRTILSCISEDVGFQGKYLYVLGVDGDPAYDG